MSNEPMTFRTDPRWQNSGCRKVASADRTIAIAQYQANPHVSWGLCLRHAASSAYLRAPVFVLPLLSTQISDTPH